MSRAAKVILSLVGGLVVIVVVVAGLFATGVFKLSNMMPADATKSPEFRTSFIDGAKRSCQSSATTSNPSASQQQIATYCECMANGMADLMTDDDMKYMLDHLGSMPPGIEQRMQPLLTQCLAKAKQ